MTLHYCQLLISRLLRIFWKITRVRRRWHIPNAIRLLSRSASLHQRRSLHCKCAVHCNCTFLTEAATCPPPLWLRASLASLATWDSIVYADSRHFFCGRSCQVRFNTYLSLRLHFCKCIYGCSSTLMRSRVVGVGIACPLQFVRPPLLLTFINWIRFILRATALHLRPIFCRQYAETILIFWHNNRTRSNRWCLAAGGCEISVYCQRSRIKTKAKL